MSGAQGVSVVLVVEDDSDIRNLLRRRIERLGHRVVEASTGEAALELARTHRPALVVLDILLPGIDGWEVLGQLRHDPDLSDVAVAVVSIVDDPGANDRPPVQGYVLKPFRTSEIDDLVRRLIGSDRDRQTENGGDQGGSFP